MTPQEILGLVAQRHGVVLRDEGPCPGGEVGARYASGAGGERFVYKWFEREDLAWAERVVTRVARLRSAGYPAPRYLDPFPIDDDVVVLVQEQAPGAWSDDLSAARVDQLLAINERQVGLGEPGSSWGDFMAQTLCEGADGYCLHDTLRREGGTTARILEWVQEVGRELVPLPQGDLVHLDFHHRNVLWDRAGDVTVIDLEGCQPGERAFDLVTLAIFLDAAEVPNLDTPVWTLLEALTTPERLRAYVAHMVLRRLDWTLRFHPDQLDRSTAAAASAMRRVDPASAAHVFGESPHL
jgi:hypothetical protein